MRRTGVTQGKDSRGDGVFLTAHGGEFTRSDGSQSESAQRHVRRLCWRGAETRAGLRVWAGGVRVADVTLLYLLAPMYLLFEMWQLVLSERYLGIKQIARGADPRALGMSEITAFCWSMVLFSYWLWMLLLLTLPRGGRAHGLGLLLISVIGFSLRRGAPMKNILVVMTFEGALRIGTLLSLCWVVWRRL